MMPKLNINLRGVLDFGRMTGGYFFTTILNNAIPFLVLPILTRFLEPAEYGNIALFNFYLALSNALTGSSIPAIVSKYFFDRDKEYISKLIGNSIGVVFIFSLTTLIIILIFQSTLQKYLELEFIWLVSIPVASFAWVCFNLGLTLIRNSKKVMLFTKHQVGNTILNFAISIVLIVILLWGWQGRVLGIIISYIISAMLMLLYLHREGYITFSFSKGIIRHILDLVLPLIPNSIQSVIISQIGIFFIQYYFTKELLGIFSVGFQISFSIKLLITALSLSWGPFIFKQLSNQKTINTIYVTRMFLLMAGVLVIGVAFINLFAEFILKLMTTKEYYGAIAFIPWFTIGFFFNGLYVFLMPILIKFEKQKYVSFVSFLNMIIMLGLNVWFADIFGYIGIVYAYSLTYFLLFLALSVKAQITYPLPWLSALKIWK